MPEVVSPPSRDWYYKRGDEFIKWQGDLMDKNDIKPSDDAAVAALREMVEKVNQTVVSMREARDMDIELFISKTDGTLKVSVVKNWY